MKCPFCIKKCSKCGELLVAYDGNFKKHKGSKYGVYSSCKSCNNKEGWQERSKQIKQGFVEKFNNKHGDKWEYINGYENEKSVIIIKCRTCGKFKKIIAHNALWKDFKCNGECSKVECKECGEIFIPHKNSIFCSDKCRRKNEHRNYGINGRIRNKSRVDYDITLPKLVSKDKGVCALCGGLVDYEDYIVTDEGHWIIGDNYPSIDHVKPLAKMGTHTWDNVQLAHFKCNRLKRDKYNNKEENLI